MVHNTLFCAELLAIICQNCDPHTLTQLSLTNRTMSHSALNELWSSIENVAPLVRCMPNDLWEERYDDSMLAYTKFTLRLFFRRAILETDWDRFILRAACVKEIGFIPGSIKYEIHPDAFMALCNSAPRGAKLLPRLRQVDFTYLHDLDRMNEQALSCAKVLLSPGLTQLVLNVKESHIAILSMLVEHCPLVVGASLIGPDREDHGSLPPGTKTCNAITLLHQWSSLQHLYVEKIHPYGISVLSSLPTLRVLEVLYIQYNPLEPRLKHPNGFARLEELVICNCCPAVCVEFMSYMNRTPLRVIEVDFNETITQDVWLVFLDAMKGGIIQDQLQSITLSCRLTGVKFNISIDLISPLFCYTHLSFISLRSWNGFNFDDNTIEAMASSWKYLKVFSVEIDLISVSRATYNSLVSFATHNPRLEALKLCLDATTLTADVVEQQPWNGIRNENLQVFDVRYSGIKDPSLVADLLHDIFPNLASISAALDVSRHGDYDFFVKKWAIVEKLLREYQDNH